MDPITYGKWFMPKYFPLFLASLILTITSKTFFVDNKFSAVPRPENLEYNFGKLFYVKRIRV